MIIYIDGIDKEATTQEALTIKAEQIALSQANEKAEADKAKAKQAVLDKLGLTVNEIEALLA
jgi:hypothetical protein